MNIESKNFPHDELKCRCGCGMNKINPSSLKRIQFLRTIIFQPLPLSSAYRCRLHPDEIKKMVPGSHFDGCAFDVRCSGFLALLVVVYGFLIGFRRIGISQRGDIKYRFIHLDDGKDSPGKPSPHIWSY